MLDLVPLCSVVVGVGPSLSVGAGPLGTRSVGEFTSVTVSGERLQGEMVGCAGADWMLRPGDYGVIDVRVTIRTVDDALVLVRYGGRLDLSSPATGYTAVVAPVFETGDERYVWLNRIQAIGKGRLIASPAGVRLDYEFYEVR